MNNIARRSVLELLEGQLNRNEQMIISILTGFDRLFALAAVIFTAALTLGLKDDRREVLLVLPVAILTTLLLGFGALIELASRQGYSRYLERRVEAEAGTSDLMWARHLAPRMVASTWTNRYLLSGLYVFFLGASCFLSIDSAFTVKRLSPWRIPAILLSVACFVCFVIAAVEATRAGSRSHQLADEGPPTP